MTYLKVPIIHYILQIYDPDFYEYRAIAAYTTEKNALQQYNYFNQYYDCRIIKETISQKILK